MGGGRKSAEICQGADFISLKKGGNCEKKCCYSYQGIPERSLVLIWTVPDSLQGLAPLVAFLGGSAKCTQGTDQQTQDNAVIRWRKGDIHPQSRQREWLAFGTQINQVLTVVVVNGEK